MAVKKKNYQKKTAEQKKEEVEKLMSILDEGVKNFTYSPDLMKYLLEMQALMPKYSFRNIMLAKAQNGHFVASYNHWKSLNRFVKSGEKAIRIFAPRFAKEKNEVTGAEESKLVGFTPIPVFDYSQTDGDPLPLDNVKLRLEGESDVANTIFNWVKKLGEEDNCPVEIGDGDGANGYYSPVEHRIVVDSSLEGNHRAKTAVHELVHSRVHGREAHRFTAEERECVAEGAAFVVCSFFGFDTSGYSFGYVRNWSSDNGESLMKFGEAIQQASSSLIEEFERLAIADSDCPSSTEETESVEQQIA